MSKTTSAVIERASINFTPTTGVISSSKIMSPWWSSLIFSSRAEQSIPLEITPFIFRWAISNPPGSTAPTGASGTWFPTSKFMAPQTMSSGPFPASTVMRRMRSAPSIRAMLSTRATMTSSSPSPTRSMPSTTRPRSSIMRRSSSTDSVMSTNSRSHESEIFMRTAPRSACRSQ